ncbi:hypothetical protein [Corynebacterium mayonis]|uniref:hypothetical protein n=1 Tax=Corynebacterium mayonis TaxID=3062461 RepID=UPI00314007B3
MAEKNSVRRVGRVSLAVIVSTAVVAAPQVAVAVETPPVSAPVEPVEPPSGQPTPPASADTVNKADSAGTAGIDEELNRLSQAINDAQAATPKAAALKSETFGDKPGAGTSGTWFTSDGKTYTGLALNPTNDKLYAILPAKDGSQDDHLLRINPATGETFDLGALTATGAEKPRGLSNATFTNDGTLVLLPTDLNDGARVFTLDLKADNAQDTTNREMKVRELKLAPEVATLGVSTLGAFASVKGEDSTSLYSFGIAQDAKALVYRYNLEDETLSAAQAAIGGNVDQARVTGEEITTAWVKGESTLVVADAAGNTIEITGDENKFAKPVIAATSQMLTEDTASEIAQASVTAVRPVTLPDGIQAVARSGEAQDASFQVTVVDDSGKKLEGATVTVGDQTLPTNAYGEVSFTNVESLPQFIKVSAEGYFTREVLPSFEGRKMTIELKKSSTSARNEILVTVLDNEGKEIQDATVRIDGRTVETDRFGEAFFDNVTSVRPVIEVSAKGFADQRVRLDSVKDTRIKLEKEKKAESTPDQIQSIIKEITPLLAALGVPVAALSGAASGSNSTSTSTTTPRTSTSRTTTPSTTASTARTSGPRTVSASMTTSTAPAAGGAANVARANSKATASAKSTSTGNKSNNGKLADTGTPMSTVIVLGMIFLLIGGAYTFVGRRREV